MIDDDHTAEVDLPSPLGTSSAPHDVVLSLAAARRRADLEEQIFNGNYENAHIIDSADEAAAAGGALEAEFAEGTANGEETFTCRLFVSASMMAAGGGINEVVLRVLAGGLENAAFAKWGGYSWGVSYYTGDVYTEVYLTVWGY